MIIVLNGPLGIGKSTLAEMLAESIDHCVMLDGDHLVAANPPPVDEMEFLHGTIVLLVAHCRGLATVTSSSTTSGVPQPISGFA